MQETKHEWRKAEKDIYLPKTKPTIVDIPRVKYFMIKGAGNPNGELFSKHIEVLYSLSYGVRMSYKKGIEPSGFYQYTVYPLEGVWDLNEQAKKNAGIEFNKDDLVYELMIRQPDFVDDDFFEIIKKLANDKQPNAMLDEVKLIEITEGKCCQMMHVGSYDDEPASFAMMEDFCCEHKITRVSKNHREIYLSDFRKTAPEKLKTVLRFRVK